MKNSFQTEVCELEEILSNKIQQSRICPWTRPFHSQETTYPLHTGQGPPMGIRDTPIEMRHVLSHVERVDVVPSIVVWCMFVKQPGNRN